jgi:uncharacterized protein YidB (DUF937 family)
MSGKGGMIGARSFFMELEMGLLDTISGALGGNGAGGNPLLNAVMQMLANKEAGGLQGLLKTLADNGLGEQVQSWVGTGQNQPVSVDALRNALGDGTLGRIANQAGVSADEAAGGLAQLLPQVVDKLTPNGELPQGDLLSQGLDLLKGKLFG